MNWSAWPHPFPLPNDSVLYKSYKLKTQSIVPFPDLKPKISPIAK